MSIGDITFTTEPTTKSMARPFVKWVGGKGKLVPQLREYLPKNCKTYYEPFVGGGAFYFAINPPVGRINDMNRVLIEAYLYIKQDVQRVINELDELQDIYWNLPDIDCKKEFYLTKRSEFNELSNESFEKAVLFIFLNKTCFNGMYRENAGGKFNVPFGRHEKPTICDRKNLLSIASELQNTTITCGSYEKAIQGAKKDDFVYFDPPYHPLKSTSSFTSYQAGGFSAEDQNRLRNVFAELADRGCYVMLSNSNTSLIKKLYKDFNIHEIHAARSINADGQGRGKIIELVVTSY